jgi:hypothetical protein
MKHFISTLAVVVIFTTITFAQKASITVFSQDGQRFFVILNGIKQNNTASTNVKVTDLNMPNYKAKIIFEDPALPAIDKMVYTQNYDGQYFDATYNIRKDKKGNLDMRLSSAGEVTPASTPASNTVAYKTVESSEPAATTTTTSQPATTTTQTTTQQTNIGMPGGVNFSTNTTIQEDENGVNVNVNLGGLNTMTTTTTTTTTTTNTVKSTSTPVAKQPAPAVQNSNPSVAKPQGCTVAASASDFATGKNSIKAQSFSDSQLKVAKTFTKNNCLSAAQIKEIMGMFSFEESKLDYAKYAYDFCVDKKNYYMLSDAFSFSSSSDDLNEFLETK